MTNSYIDDEFVIGFNELNHESITPIDIISEVTGATFDEIRKCYETIVIKENEVKSFDYFSDLQDVPFFTGSKTCYFKGECQSQSNGTVNYCNLNGYCQYQQITKSTGN